MQEAKSLAKQNLQNNENIRVLRSVQNCLELSFEKFVPLLYFFFFLITIYIVTLTAILSKSCCKRRHLSVADFKTHARDGMKKKKKNDKNLVVKIK